jgi:hypothetical protein
LSTGTFQQRTRISIDAAGAADAGRLG